MVGVGSAKPREGVSHPAWLEQQALKLGRGTEMVTFSGSWAQFGRAALEKDILAQQSAQVAAKGHTMKRRRLTNCSSVLLLASVMRRVSKAVS